MHTRGYMVLVAAWTVLAFMPLSVGQAQEEKKPSQPKAGSSTKELDQKIYDTLRDVINHGAGLYNNEQDYAGCYRVYEGALMVLHPMLRHRPELQKAIMEGRERAKTAPLMWRRAFALRDVIDKIRADIRADQGEKLPTTPTKPPTTPTKPPTTPTKPMLLWDQLGGKEGVTQLVSDLMAAVKADPRLKDILSKQTPVAKEAALKERLIAYISSLTGGKIKYAGEDLKKEYAAKGVTKEQYDALVAHFKAALNKKKLKPTVAKKLTAAVEEARSEVAKKPKPPTTAWDRLGGEAGVSKLVDELFAAVGADPKVNFFRGKKPTPAKVEMVKKSVVAFFSSVTGGPLKYTGENMKKAHMGMGISNDQYDAFMGHFKAVLAKQKVPTDLAKDLTSKVEGMRKDIVEPQKPTGSKPAEKKPAEKKPAEKKPATGTKPAEKKPGTGTKPPAPTPPAKPAKETKPKEKAPN